LLGLATSVRGCGTAFTGVSDALMYPPAILK